MTGALRVRPGAPVRTARDRPPLAPPPARQCVSSIAHAPRARLQTGARRASEVGISGPFCFFASRQNVPTAKQYNAPLWTHRWASLNRCPRPQSPSPRRGSECRRHPGNVPHAPPAHPCTPRGRAVLTLPQALVLPEFLEPRPHGILQHVPLGEASSLGTVACDSPPAVLTWTVRCPRRRPSRPRHQKQTP